MYGNIDLTKLTAARLTELDQFLDEFGRRWHLVGPCLDNAWYAWRRGDDTAPRVHGATLPALARALTAAEHGS